MDIEIGRYGSKEVCVSMDIDFFKRMILEITAHTGAASDAPLTSSFILAFQIAQDRYEEEAAKEKG